ncbi:MAG: 6-bladed beta-propeller [Bacteroidales bacterium]|nr:6-bladed beta-propeller [Bacteroidales bacterium]
MKRIIFLFLILCCVSKTQAQTLLDVYKTGTINLIEDTEYAKNTDWNKLFDDRTDTVNGNPVGVMKSISVSKTGEVFIGNYSKYNIYKFDKNGNYVKEFGKKGSNKGEFLYRPTLHGILGNKYVFASDHQGRIQFYNLNGEFYKMVKIDYMPLQITPLKDNKIAIWGHVPYSGNTKYIVSIKDIETGKEVIVDSYMNSLINLKPIVIKLKEGGMVSFSPSSIRDKTIIERTFEGNLIVGHNTESKLSVYSPNGEKIKDIELNQSPIKTSEKMKTEFIERVKNYLIEKNIYEENKALLNDPNIYPDYFPMFYALKSDPEGNILVFNHSEDTGNSFYVYDKTGNFICKTKLISDDFKLSINSRFASFEIHPNGLYAFVTVIDSNTSEIKIIRTLLK